jgi:acetylornithine/N-succinyldiaminopimelate aminotransferase
MNASELLAIAEKRLYPNYKPAPIVIARGKGSELFDVDGRRWLDFAAGVAVCALGHAHPKLVAALAEQAAKVMHVSNYFYNEQNVRLADRLCALSGMDRAFFCNSGAEANEAMYKMTRRHFYAKGEANRIRFIAFDNAFHGRTMGAVSLTGTPKYREGFGAVEGITHVPYGDLDAVAKNMSRDVAAIIAEPVQGEGGVLPAPKGFLEGLRELCDRHGALLLLDEVQTGIGRTGSWFGHQTTSPGLEPDAMSVAKGLGGGCPIGAMLTTEALSGALPPGTHGTTFGGNPFASAAARTVLATIEEEGLVAGARKKGERLSALLGDVARELPQICERERGAGLLRGLVLRQGFLARDILPKLADAGVLLTAAGERVLRFTPPLVITEDEIAEGVAIVRAVLRAHAP